jgi:hypothetical protein
LLASYSQNAQLKIKSAENQVFFPSNIKKNRQISLHGSSRVSQNTKGCLKTIYFYT